MSNSSSLTLVKLNMVPCAREVVYTWLLHVSNYRNLALPTFSVVRLKPSSYFVKFFKVYFVSNCQCLQLHVQVKLAITNVGNAVLTYLWMSKSDSLIANQSKSDSLTANQSKSDSLTANQSKSSQTQSFENDCIDDLDPTRL